MEMWFSEFHTPDVKHSIRVNRQLYSKQSDYQRIDIFETPEFGRVLTLDGNVMLTERDEFIYDEMITHVPMSVHRSAKDILVIGAGDGGVVRELTRYDRVERTLPLQEQAAPAEEPGDAGKSGGGLRALMPLLAIMMGVIICQGTLRDGITTWMPTYLADTYHMESGKSILTGVLLPLFGMVCYQIVLWMNRKLVKNELQCAAIIFGVGLVSLLALRLLHAHSFALSVLILAFAVGSMHGVNLIMTCMTPKYLAGSGKISMISGLLNACTYIGSALSMYGVALIADRFGWTVTESLWCAVALLGTLCAAACVPKWGKLRKGQ